MGLQIDVYDNIYMYKECYGKNIDNPYYHSKLVDIFIKPPDNAFWFTTNLALPEKSRPDLFKSFVHFHSNMIYPNENAIYEKGTEPILITKDEIFYDPSEFKYGKIVIKPPRFWGKPLWECQVGRYYGDTNPKKKVKIGYNWFYDHNQNKINMILGFMGIRS